MLATQKDQQKMTLHKKHLKQAMLIIVLLLFSTNITLTSNTKTNCLEQRKQRMKKREKRRKNDP